MQIDGLAGPSEVLIIADENANPEWAAYDLLSQAEHEERAVPILVTTSANTCGKNKKRGYQRYRIKNRKTHHKKDFY